MKGLLPRSVEHDQSIFFSCQFALEVGVPENKDIGLPADDSRAEAEEDTQDEYEGPTTHFRKENPEISP